MKHFNFLVLSLILISNTVFSQTKNFIDLPYIETSATVDTLVTPDKIYLTIILTEKDTKGKISVEELEQKMADRLIEIGIDLSKQLEISDLSSNFKKYFLKQKDVLKSKSYSLLVYDAKTAMKVVVELEKEDISNVSLEKTEYSQIESLKLELKTKAVLKAKDKAISMTEVLNQKVGNAIFISDLGKNSDNSDILQGRLAGVMVRGYSSVKKSSSLEDVEIEIQKIKVEAEVSIKFKLE
jgi:predicted transcriptional regulator